MTKSFVTILLLVAAIAVAFSVFYQLAGDSEHSWDCLESGVGVEAWLIVLHLVCGLGDSSEGIE